MFFGICLLNSMKLHADDDDDDDPNDVVLRIMCSTFEFG